MSSQNILDHFIELSDLREDTKRHKLIDIITIVFCACICGAEKWKDIETFDRSNESWFRRYLELPHGQEIFNIDGKTLRRSHGEGKPAIHMVSDWANKAGFTQGQVKRDEKSNEITAILELVEMLELKGWRVTTEAMGTQKTIAAKGISCWDVRGKEADSGEVLVRSPR